MTVKGSKSRVQNHKSFRECPLWDNLSSTMVTFECARCKCTKTDDVADHDYKIVQGVTVCIDCQNNYQE